jgi:hypothetical protein
MKHSRFGLVFLVSCGGLLACNGDPTASIRDDTPPRIIADPSIIYAGTGSSTNLTVQLVDGQGNQLPATFDATSGGAQATVVRDTTFLQTTNGTNLNTKERFVVTAGTLGSTTITVTGGGQTLDVPFGSLPIVVDAAFAPAALVQNQPSTITAPAGYSFAPNATIVFGANAGIVFSRAPDGSAFTFLPPPGTNGFGTVNGVVSELFPNQPLTLPTVATLTSDTLATLPGTDAPGTAPSLVIPAAGTLTVSRDKPDFVATIDHFYNLNITEAGDYTITVDWVAGSDLDLALDGDFGLGGATANKPEAIETTLTAGVHSLLVEDFGGDAAGTILTITITH